MDIDRTFVALTPVDTDYYIGQIHIRPECISTIVSTSAGAEIYTTTGQHFHVQEPKHHILYLVAGATLSAYNLARQFTGGQK